MARNATAQGVPWGVIEGFGTYTKPSSMLYLGAEDAECWDLMRWNGSDTGIACFKWSISERPAQVTAKNASDVLCASSEGRYLRNVCCDPPGLVTGESLHRHSSTSLVSVVDIRERLERALRFELL
jgi:hypothetical protein